MAADTPLARMESALEDITRLCGELRDLLTEERAALVAARRDALPGLLRKKADGLQRLAEADGRRRRCALQLERAWGWAPVDRPLSQLASRLDGPTRERLAGKKDRLLRVMRDLCALNEANGRLIRQAVTVGRRLLEWATAPRDLIYGPAGIRPDEAGRVVHQRV